MKSDQNYQVRILFIVLAIILIVGIIGSLIYIDHKPKVLILPEEICQASKGDHMQLFQRNDTIFLEYTFARKPEPSPKIQGQQVTVGENIDYSQDNIVNVDTLKKLYKLSESIDSLLRKK